MQAFNTAACRGSWQQSQKPQRAQIHSWSFLSWYCAFTHIVLLSNSILSLTEQSTDSKNTVFWSYKLHWNSLKQFKYLNLVTLVFRYQKQVETKKFGKSYFLPKRHIVSILLENYQHKKDRNVVIYLIQGFNVEL